MLFGEKLGAFCDTGSLCVCLFGEHGLCLRYRLFAVERWIKK